MLTVQDLLDSIEFEGPIGVKDPEGNWLKEPIAHFGLYPRDIEAYLGSPVGYMYAIDYCNDAPALILGLAKED